MQTKRSGLRQGARRQSEVRRGEVWLAPSHVEDNEIDSVACEEEVVKGVEDALAAEVVDDQTDLEGGR